MRQMKNSWTRNDGDNNKNRNSNDNNFGRTVGKSIWTPIHWTDFGQISSSWILVAQFSCQWNRYADGLVGRTMCVCNWMVYVGNARHHRFHLWSSTYLAFSCEVYVSWLHFKMTKPKYLGVKTQYASNNYFALFVLKLPKMSRNFRTYQKTMLYLTLFNTMRLVVVLVFSKSLWHTDISTLHQKFIHIQQLSDIFRGSPKSQNF